MSVANFDDLPQCATVILYVSKSRQLWVNGECLGLDQASFRCDPDGISVTWVEYFQGDANQQLAKASLAMRGTLKFKTSGMVARASVGALLATMKQAGREIRVRRDSQPANKGHCLIEGINPSESGLLLALATAFPATDFQSCKDIPGLT